MMKLLNGLKRVLLAAFLTAWVSVNEFLDRIEDRAANK